ncbi:MAG: CehA/McbA family metallohydrolase, partial [Oscillospiraceae bacterium]|nr:CehA/McbA family metallohydrolase [Oscillospiraceae bacterium]
NADGTYRIVNVEKTKYLSYDTGYGSYGIYAEPSDAQLDDLTLTVYVEPEEYAVPDGDYVIWAPAYNMSLSSEYTGYYNKGVEVTEDGEKLSGYGSTEIWTVTNNDDGTITISYNGKNLAMADSYSSLTLGEKNDKWVFEDAGNGLYYVKNDVRGAYIEWYASKNNWSGYNYINSGSEGMFALKFTPAEEVADSNLPAEGDEVVIYNLSAQGVLAAENDTQSIENALAEIFDGKAFPENGAVIFTVSKNGEYYRFYNETYGWLCSNGTGNNAFYTQEASDDADWILHEGKSGGWNLESRTAKYNGTYSQYLEYYADSYKTYSMYNVTDYDIYEFFFYPVEESVNVSAGIVNDPRIVLEAENPYAGQDWVVTFTVDAVFGLKGDIVVTVYADPTGDGSESREIPGAAVLAGPDGEGKYTVTVSKDVIAECGKGIVLDITAEDNTGHMFGEMAGFEIIDEPGIGEVSPAANSQTGEDKRPVISAEITNAGEDATVTMTVNGEEVEAVYDGEKVTYTPSEDLADGRTSVTVTVVRADGKEAQKNWSFIVGEAQYQLYFGQLHSHTTYSDGSGSLEAALDYILNLPDSANVDFVAFTDHSNYFDASGAANPEESLYDASLMTADSQTLWSEYKGTIAEFNASQSNVIAIGGFEMTWSGGPGHINTFNTEGIVSRNNTTLNNKTNDAGMKAYYALLSQAEGVDSLSQFNHPGSTFGTFTDFAYWDALIDTRIQMVEVGNGEGQVGAGGYYPSYEYYTMALDKGWHVAPTNNQDNHKGKWGNANDARDVVLTDNFTEEGIYEAIRAMRMYSTEDKNLEIGYTVNGMLLGSVIEEVPEKLNIEVTVYDPDTSDSISKVEVIVNSGKVAYTWDDPADLADGALSAEIDPDYSYYYIRVTEGDGDLAVTAPVWVGESLKLGISSVATTTSTPVTGEELTITTTLFNSETTEATVKSLTYTTNGSQTIGLDVTGYTLPASGTLAVDFAYTPEAERLTTVTVTAVVELEGVEYVFTMDIELDVQDASKLVYIGIDASHYNEYVNGNYKDNMGNFSELAAEYGVRTVTIYESEDLIAACSNPKYKALILTAPSRRSSEAQASDPLKVYTDEEIAAIVEFNENGGIVILAGWSDHYENYPAVESIANMKPEEHMAATQNAVLEALGSSLRIGDDATYDDDYNGGQAYRLYFNTYGESFLTEGVEVDPENPHDRLYTEVFSHYGGASVYTVGGTLSSTVAPVVFGHSGTYSVDVDSDGLGGDSMYKYTSPEGDERLMIMASEQLEGKGLIIVSGAAFMSNFEVQATIEDSGSEKNYSNYKICENLLAYINPVTVTPIAEVQAQPDEGVKYTIEGIVTSNASGYDKDTAFFDCIYVQDETGGINAFPVAGNYKIGDKVRITGTTSSYNGERQIAVTDIEVIGEGTVEPEKVTPEQVNDGSVLGKLITVNGIITNYEYENGLIQTIYVKDYDNDNVVRVFIDGYITTSYDVENIAIGADVTVTGLASYDNSFDGPAPRIRIRDRKDVVVGDYAYVTVNYDANGGKVEHPVKGYPFGSGISPVQIPTREGYTFEGWYDEDGVKLDSSYRLYRNTTFTAKWTEGTGGGSGSTGSTHKHDWTKWEDKGAYSERTCPDCGFIERVYTGRTDDEGNPETGAPVKATSAVSAIAVLAAAAFVLGKRK